MASAWIFSPFLLPCVKQSCSCRYIDYGRMKLPNWPKAISFSSQEKFWTSRSFCLQVSLFKSSCITCMEVRTELRPCFLLLGVWIAVLVPIEVPNISYAEELSNIQGDADACWQLMKRASPKLTYWFIGQTRCGFWSVGHCQLGISFRFLTCIKGLTFYHFVMELHRCFWFLLMHFANNQPYMSIVWCCLAIHYSDPDQANMICPTLETALDGLASVHAHVTRRGESGEDLNPNLVDVDNSNSIACRCGVGYDARKFWRTWIIRLSIVDYVNHIVRYLTILTNLSKYKSSPVNTSSLL